jgi:hypothetical protein
MYVISNDGRLLFSGSRHDCKQFVRKNNVKQFKFKEHFSEKVVVAEPEVIVEKEEEVVDTPETFFSRVFTVNNE